MRIYKITFLALLSFVSATSNLKAQTGRVGVNTDDPKSTLDITGSKNINGELLATDVTGLQAPRLTRAELTAKGNSLYGTDQRGTLIYINNITGGDNLSQRQNVTAIGYYYFDGNFWQKFLDTDTIVTPTGFERRPDMGASNFYWRLIGAPVANYGVEGKYGLDATWNPTDLSEVLIPGSPDFTYSMLLGASGLTVANLGAMGKNSFVAGTINSASGIGSTSLGIANEASGMASFAVGALVKATGQFSTSMGRGTLSSGISSFSAGLLSQATNQAAIAMGNTSIASGENSVAIGQANTASAQGTLAIGNTNTASAISAVGIGQENRASGQGSLAIGNTNNVSNTSSVGIGQENIVAGNAAVAIGNSNNLSSTATSSVALGFINSVTAESSFAIGNSNTLSATRTFAMGSLNVLTGQYSKAIGYGATASSMYATSLGVYNTLEGTPEASSYSNLSKRLLVIGKGSSSSARGDALTILRNGKVGIDINNFEGTSSSGDAKLQVNGTVKIATLSTSSTCNAANEGTIQYVKTTGVGSFQGCTQTVSSPATFAWVNLN
ncbi:hypothetical protein [Chryseobacterium sp. FH1]|uniref:hypothetical protein n=1 Tax=Chryseobacterium sp. FH1 TaxID=1233951 RepID=UPI0004E3E1E9|nr:hypothetical protein [Chryseobacterium sp. FH1]KFC19707.1 hypothetical protein IO90_10630 [Chryseobacterium sp. FH1]